MPVSAKEYQDLVRREMARYKGDPKGGDLRDRAIRSANIAAGYGNSTALKHPITTREGRVARGSADAGEGVPRPKPRPDGGGGGGRGGGGGVPLPKRRPEPDFPPDLAVSPPRGELNRWPGATAGPVQMLPAVPNPGLMGVPQDLRSAGAARAGLNGDPRVLSALLGGNSPFPMRWLPIDWLGGQ